MNPIAISTGSTVIYWSAVVIALGIAAGFALSYSLYISHGGRSAAMWLLLPLALLFSVPLCRAIHWYCHPEQYTSFIRAITDYSTGSYCLPGALLGTFLAALVVRGLGLTGNMARLLDCVAPGGALIVVFIRLSALFNSSCRSKIAITTPLLQHLPIGSGITNSMGAVEYRFATFFVQAILMLCVTVLLLYFFFARRRLPMKEGCPRDGNVAWMFLIFHSAVELLMDSTRYDSSFMHFNAFVSIVQIASAVCILAALIHYSRLSHKVNGRCGYHVAMWIGYVLTLVGTGASEYLVQRFGNMYPICYTVMTITCTMMAVIVYLMYKTTCAEREEPDYD